MMKRIHKLLIQEAAAHKAMGIITMQDLQTFYLIDNRRRRIALYEWNDLNGAAITLYKILRLLFYQAYNHHPLPKHQVV